MNPIDINRRIAELCGWTHIEDNKALMLGVPVWIGYPPAGAMVGKKQPTPNYYESLDACSSFENFTTRKELDEYADELCNMCDDGSPDPDIAAVITATAPQRCEAFLRMKGEWVE